MGVIMIKEQLGNDTQKSRFQQWLEQQHDQIDVDCGCVSIEAFMYWLQVAYEAGGDLNEQWLSTCHLGND